MNILVCIPRGFNSARHVQAKLIEVLRDLEVDTIELVSHSDEAVRDMSILRAAKLRWNGEIGPNRSDAHRPVARADLVVIFWDGEILSNVLFEARIQKKPTKLFPVEVAKVVNKDKGEPYDFYIGRGTPWGNPFHVGSGPDKYSREDAVRLFRELFEKEILTDPRKRTALLRMRGHRLGCHCKPLPCHGDVIVEFLNSIAPDDPILQSLNREQLTLQVN